MPSVFAYFWLARTHAFEVQPGETAELLRTTEDCSIPYRTMTGRYIVARTSTESECIALHNAATGHRDSMNAAALPEWPWTCLLDKLPARTGHRAHSFTFPEASVQEPSKEGAGVK